MSEGRNRMNTGKIIIHLDELLKEKGLSKNKFAQRAEMQRTQLNKYINNEVVLLNIDVLARMCSVLGCEIADLLEYKKEDDDTPGASHPATQQATE